MMSLCTLEMSQRTEALCHVSMKSWQYEQLKVSYLYKHPHKILLGGLLAVNVVTLT